MHLVLLIAAGIVLGYYTIVGIEKWKEHRRYKRGMAMLDITHQRTQPTKRGLVSLMLFG
jgi:hypothetical protein